MSKVRRESAIVDAPSQTHPQDSMIVVDCGSTSTKAVLLDVVEGQYRFIAYAQAPSSVHEPWENVSLGVIAALHQLEEVTGRQFLDGKDQLITPERTDGSGVDRFLAISSAARPLRVMLAGLVRDVSLASARRATLSTYTSIEGEIAFEQDPTRPEPRTIDDEINAIWRTSPEVICVVGGTDGGAARPVLEMVQNIVRVALYLLGDHVPIVLYAGNTELREAVAQHLGELATLQSVDNVRPRAGMENIGATNEELEFLFYDRKVQDISGLPVLNSWSALAVLPTARAADYTIRYCQRAWKSAKPALGVDVGGASVTINVCQDGWPLTTIRTDLGMGRGMLGALDEIEMDDIMRWLPFEISTSEARNRLLNKALRPHSIPQTREDLLLEQAVAREVIRLTLADSLPGWPGHLDSRFSTGYSLEDQLVQSDPVGQAAFAGADSSHDTLMIPPCEPIIACGSLLTRTPYQGHAALILLDALQPTGVSTMYLDEYNLVPSLGAAASVDPLATVQALHNGGLTYLGTVVVPLGRARSGERVLTIRPVDKQLSIRLDVMHGELEVVPRQLFEPGTMLELDPAHGIDIGRGHGKSLKIQYMGGSVGLIVDARGRPLEFAADPRVQRQRIDHWLWEMMSG